MSPEYDFLVPLYRVRWSTRAVLEGITTRYQPRTIHLVAPKAQVQQLALLAQNWSETIPLELHPEEEFFRSDELTKEKICAELDLGKSLYTPGWFYQQLLKLGAFEGIDSLSEWYVVWDSDLLPIASWSLTEQEAKLKYSFALLQHKNWGNSKIVAQWQDWIVKVLQVEPIRDLEATFVSHHMWFKQEHLKSLARQVNDYYQSDEHWLKLMMRSANDFGTFSEYWAYTSWVAANSPQDLSFYPYQSFGSTTERFFDDGTSMFSHALKQHYPQLSETELSPTYDQVYSFVLSAYGSDSLPSSLSIESSPRHLQKDRQNMHIEELRSRWNPRN